MERFLARMERRFGRLAPDDLATPLVALTAIGTALSLFAPQVLGLLQLDREAVFAGELWRIVTFLFVPARGGSGDLLGPLFAILALLFFYTITTSLQAEWGSFRFSAFYATGALLTLASGLLVGPVSGFYLNEALFLAFALLFPDFELLLFPLPIPIKVKWFGLLAGLLMAWSFISGGWAVRAAIGVAVLLLAVFCGEVLRARLSGVAGGVAAQRRRSRLEGTFTPPARRTRVCALCGKTEKDDPNLEFRVCDCQERCGGKLTEYCLPHARAH